MSKPCEGVGPRKEEQTRIVILIDMISLPPLQPVTSLFQ